jgi:hypothetical protein
MKFCAEDFFCKQLFLVAERERERVVKRERERKKTVWSGALTLTKGLLDIIPRLSIF